MGVGQKKRGGPGENDIRTAVGGLFACGHFVPSRFPLPPEPGAQLSLTGETAAVGNGGALDFSREALLSALRTYPAMYSTSEAELERWIRRGRYTVLCGEADRSAAVVGSAAELIRCGIYRILVTADTPEERDALTEAFERQRNEFDGVSVTGYRLREYDEWAGRRASELVYGYLTADRPAIFVLGRDSFCRNTNLLRRDGENGSLCALLARAHPAVLASSETVDGARTLARLGETFAPTATVLFAGEVRRLRDAVLYCPEDDGARVIPEQLTMG